MRNKTILLLGAAIALGALGATAMGQNATPGTSGPFTGPQAAAGHQAYENNCAPCHLQDMSGTNDAPALAGTASRDDHERFGCIGVHRRCRGLGRWRSRAHCR